MNPRNVSEDDNSVTSRASWQTRRALLGLVGAGGLVQLLTRESSGTVTAAAPPDEVDPPLVHEQGWEPVRPTFSETPTHEQSWTPVRPEFDTDPTHRQPWDPERPTIQSSPVHVEIWTEGPPPNPVTEAQPTDLDGDSRYEDINGNGEFDIGDVQALFALLNSTEGKEYLNNNVEYFDFNGNGEIDIGDVQALFTEFISS